MLSVNKNGSKMIIGSPTEFCRREMLKTTQVAVIAVDVVIAGGVSSHRLHTNNFLKHPLNAVRTRRRLPSSPSMWSSPAMCPHTDVTQASV